MFLKVNNQFKNSDVLRAHPRFILDCRGKKSHPSKADNSICKFCPYVPRKVLPSLLRTYSVDSFQIVSRSANKTTAVESAARFSSLSHVIFRTLEESDNLRWIGQGQPKTS